MVDENKAVPAPTEHIEHGEKGALRGSAAVVGLAPTEQYVRPAMQLDPPPASTVSAAGSDD